MSRFFQAGSDSDSSSDEEELYGSSVESGSEQAGDESSEEEQDSEDESDEEGGAGAGQDEGEDEDEGEGKPAAGGYMANQFLKGAGSSDSDSSDDEERRVVKSAKEKWVDEIEGYNKAIENGKKINDYVAMLDAFDKMVHRYEKGKNQHKMVPTQYVKTIADLESYIVEQSKEKKKLNPSQNKALNTSKQRIRKVAKDFEDKIKDYRQDPEGFEQRAGTPKPSVPATPTQKEASPSLAPQVAADDDSGFSTVGKGGKALQFNSENVFKTLISIVETRGKKNTDRAEQVKILEELVKVAATPYQLISVLLMLVPIRFDLIAPGNVMATENWKKAESDIRQLFQVLEENASTYRVSESAPEPEDLEQGPQPGPDGVKEIPGSIISLLERLDDELTRALQGIDPHTTEYVDRLRDEADLYNLMLRGQVYLEHNSKNPEPLSRLLVRRLDHIYYKPTKVIITAEKNAWTKVPAGLESQLSPRLSQDAEPGREYTIDLVNSICSVLYQQPNTIFRTKAMLSHIYHYALNDHYFQARDMFLMSHLQSSIHNAEPAIQMLFNRALVQVGLCAFRSGLISEAQSSLQEICSSSKLRELLGQGARFQSVDKQRLLPFHMHINLELLECVYLTCSLLVEIPVMASLGASNNSADAKKKVISKPFRRMLDYNDRQVFTGPPENTRDHIMQAAKALLNGEWTVARDLLTSIKIWKLMGPNGQKIKDMLTVKLQEEGLRTYLFSYGPYYQSLALETLQSLFGMERRKVAAVVSKMVANQEIAAALDQRTDSVVFRQGVELSKLQLLAQALGDRAVQLAERNERLAAGGLQLDNTGSSNAPRQGGGGNQSNQHRPQGGQHGNRRQPQNQSRPVRA